MQCECAVLRGVLRCVRSALCCVPKGQVLRSGPFLLQYGADIKGGQVLIVEGNEFYDSDSVKCSFSFFTLHYFIEGFILTFPHSFIHKQSYIVNGTFISSQKIQCGTITLK
jgi:hypothetical protein